jgi:hypothetical protein
MYVEERGCILGAPSFSPYRHWVGEHRREVLETVYVCQIRTWVIQRAVRNGSLSSTSTRRTTKHTLYCTRPEATLIANANMTVLNKNDNRAWTNDKRRIPLEVMATSDT